MFSPEAIAEVASKTDALRSQITETHSKSEAREQRFAAKVDADSQLAAADTDLDVSKQALAASKAELDAAYEALFAPPA